MVDPRDIRIVETTPGGARRPMSGPSLAEEETFWDENIQVLTRKRFLQKIFIKSLYVVISNM